VVTVLDTTGRALGNVPVVRARSGKATDRTILVKVRAPREIATQIAGIRVQEEFVSQPLEQAVERLEDDTLVCRCERVTLAEIKAVIQAGARDVNEIKGLTRAGMGACGAKTCASLIQRAFRELGVPLDEVTEGVRRPLFVETPLGVLAGLDEEEENAKRIRRHHRRRGERGSAAGVAVGRGRVAHAGVGLLA
jgi:bacterioferritin-associated ferredoxin